MLRNFPSADQCSPEDLDAIADLVVSDPRASYDLAGSRAHIEALCRRYQALAQDLRVERECSAPLLPTIAALERSLAAATNDLDSARVEIRALQSTLDHERNERQAEVLAAEGERARADDAESLVEVHEAIARAALAIVTRTAPVGIAELVHAVDGRLSRALARERAISAALGGKLEDALRQLEDQQRTRALDDQLRSTTRAVTGREDEIVQQDLDVELAAHPEVGPLHHARDMRDQEDTTP